MIEQVHVLQIVGDPVGGIRRHVHALLFGLSERGIRQSYAYSASSCDLVFRKELPGLERTLEGRLLPLRISKKPAFGDIANLIRLRRYVNANGITVVHGHGAKGGAYARLLAMLCKVSAVYTPHGGAVHNMFGKLEGFVYTLAEKVFLPMTDRLVFESKYSARAYFNKVGKQPPNWTVNHNGISLPAAREPEKSFPGPGEIINVGVFGMLRAQKGQIYAVRAVEKLVRSNSNILLHVYGDGPDRAQLASEAQKLGVADKVVFHGETDVPLAHMAEMDIVLIPSLFESFGYVAIEAFSLKRPVVASDAGGLPEIVSEGLDGLLVERGSPDGIAGAILRLIGEPGLAGKISAGGYRKLAANFSLDGMLDRLAEIYKNAGTEGTRGLS